MLVQSIKQSISTIYCIFRVKTNAHMAFRLSFILILLGDALMTLTEFVGIWVLLSSFSSIGGWTFEQVSLLFGIVYFSFAIAETLGKGFERAYSLVYSGDFDRFLVRPCGVVEQLIGYDISLQKMGGLSIGLAIIILSLINLDLPFSFHSFALIIYSIVTTTILFFSLFMLHGVVSFYILKPFEPLNILTYGAKEAGSFPMNIYPRVLKVILLVFLPVSSTVYVPISSFLNNPASYSKLEIIFPLSSVLFFMCSITLWKRALSHYQSTGT